MVSKVIPPPPVPAQNQLLAALPAAELRRLQPQLEAVFLEAQQILHDPSRPMQHVYFPTAGVVSTLLVLEGRITIEVAMVGREGMVGVPLFLGDSDGSSANRQAMVLQTGAALRLDADTFRKAAAPGNALHDLMLRYTSAYLNQVAFTAACNRFHSIEQHVCCWLLQLHDRLDTNRIALTQELFAQLLGVRRASITAAARKLQWDDVIHYHWGRMKILDRRGLEAGACTCYKALRDGFQRLFPPMQPPAES